MPRPAWEIRPGQFPGELDLFHNRRPVRSGLLSIEEAMREVRRQDGDANEVTVVEDDGYETRHRL